MELHEIRKLIFGGESEFVEFKHKVSHPEKVVREVVAFANSSGGHLIIGVDDNRVITGLKYADEEDYILKKGIEELCRPAIRYQSELIPLSTKKALLHYYIFAGEKKPYYAFESTKHPYGKAFVRIHDRSVQASKEVRRVLKLSSLNSSTHFEYSDQAKKLFDFLQINQRITLKEYRMLTGMNYREASDMLVRLVMAKVLKLSPGEKEDWYSPLE